MTPFQFWQFCLDLFAGFTVVGVRAFGFGWSLGHVGAFLGLAVVLGAHAVVSIDLPSTHTLPAPPPAAKMPGSDWAIA